MGRSVLGPRKTIEETLATTEQEGFTFKKDLSALDVTVFGVGVSVAAGIVCVLAALCFAEFAAMVPVAAAPTRSPTRRSASWSHFVIGWGVVLEFTVGSAAVAVGWSAPSRARAAAALPDAARAARAAHADPRRAGLPGPDGQPQRRHLDPLRRMDGHRPGRLRRLLQAAHPAARDGRREQMSSIASRNRPRCPR